MLGPYLTSWTEYSMIKINNETKKRNGNEIGNTIKIIKNLVV